ncbi:hypothetical protein V2J09_006485 [Rumex salicifolius]
MSLQKGFPLLFQQFKALLWKNMLLSWRNKRATFIQIFSSLFILLIMFIVQKSINGSNGPPNLDPKSLVFPPIPRCEDKYFLRRPCYDFIWSGNHSDRISQIVDRIRANNPGRPIPPSKVKSFASTEEVDAWIMNNSNRCSGALYFADRNATVISYGIQTNSTAIQWKGQQENPVLKFQIPLQIAAEREIARFLNGDPALSWTVGFKEFPQPPKEDEEKSQLVYFIQPTFFLASALFGFVFQMSSLVMEKELKLRQAMEMMGLYDTAYWLSWLVMETILVLISSFFIVIFGLAFRFSFFLHNSLPVVYLVFFLFQLNMTALAFMLSTFISNASSTTTIGFLNFTVGFVIMMVAQTGFPYDFNFSRSQVVLDRVRFLWSFYPPNLLAKAIMLLQKAAIQPQDAGITWSERAKCEEMEDGLGCGMTINKIYLWLISTFFVWFVLALYFDNVVPNPYGVRKSAIYFLMPGYWTGKGGNKAEEGGICSCMSSATKVEHITPDDEDVLEEENRVKQQVSGGEVDPNVAVQIRGLVKIYPGARQCCCTCKRKSPFHAVRGLWVNFAKDQLFCLLGPNGAGKTTVINCLTGVMPVTAGDAFIHGYSIRTSTGMSNIRRMIGVCPQFDILWDALNGEEHLYLFASIKGLPLPSIKNLVRQSLHEVRLTHASRVRATSYSGGMKRRLSFAIALIGDPKLIVLDEPTTGMDPISRRHVWDMIERAKRGRAIILTTHSMEEADVLSDRIGIMAKGRLRCIGTSIRLKSRFGSGFVANVSFAGNVNGDANESIYQKAVKQFFNVHLNVVPKEENKAFTTFIIPNQKERLLQGFFAELQDRQEELGILDVQLGLTTLEEVFLNIARQAELDNSKAQGKMATLTLTKSKIKIPIGARFVGIPGTESSENPRGIMVEVYWEPDDTGSLCISGHSPEFPVPQNARITTTAEPRRRSWLLGRTREAHGVIIELPNPSPFRQ